IKRYFKHHTIHAFLAAKEALSFIKEAPTDEQPTIILLDINMPEIDGWEFIELFLQLDDDKLQYKKIFMLSSSIDNKDMEKAAAYDCVIGYITKPLNKLKLLEVVEKTTKILS
ncbi:MAG: response regulator, partial [Bacteroidota bacterium]